MIRALKDINWNQFYCFYEVARKGSVKKAAEILRVSSPTVSEQIRKFESFIGQRLFHRDSRRMKLTGDGENLYAFAREMFGTGTRFLDSVSQSSIGGYTARVGLQETAAEHAAIQFVSRYWDLFSPYGVVSTYREVFPEYLLKKLISGDFDWVIGLEPARSHRLAWEKIAETKIVFCCSPKIYSRFREKEDILRLLPLARSSWDDILNQKVDDHLHSRGIYPEETIETDHWEFGISLVQRGRCVAAFSEDIVENANWKSTVKTFTFGESMSVPLYAIWKQSSERMVSIRKLKELLRGGDDPSIYEDHEHQVRIMGVPREG